jgi:drug/metabolite transporter (DMT)-like permease
MQQQNIDMTIAPSHASIREAAGIGAAFVTVVIWAGWIVATRFSAETALGPVEIGLLRYGPPALVLAPVWWRTGLIPRHVPVWIMAIIVAGGGAPFLLIAASAMRYAPAGEIGALLPGTMPLWAALMGCLLGTAHFSRLQLLGYALITLGIGAIAAADLQHLRSTGTAPSAWIGHVLFLVAAACWAAYGHAFKRSGLTALQAVAIVAAWSFLVHVMLAAVLGTTLWQTPGPILISQTLIQGGLSGLVAIVAYGLAIERLGATRAASFSALVPALALLGGMLFLGETPTPAAWLATVSVTGGVALACRSRSAPQAK